MKKLLLRSENLLLLFLLLIPSFAIWVTSGTVLDIFYRDKFLMRPIFYRIWVMCFIGTTSSYYFHFLFRKNNRRQKIICNLHIAVTTLMIAAVFDDFFAHIPFKAMITTLPPPSTAAYLSMAQNRYQQVFVAWQMLFVVYGLFMVFSNHKPEAGKK